MSRDNALLAAAGVQRATLVAGFAAALVAALLAGLLSRSLTRPLAAMVESLKRFTGEEEVTLPAKATDEVDTLARAFARMAASIREKDGGPASGNRRANARGGTRANPCCTLGIGE